MKIEGEPAKRFKIFAADINGKAVGDPQGAYDTAKEALTHHRHAGRRLVVYDRRTPIEWDKLAELAKGEAEE